MPGIEQQRPAFQFGVFEVNPHTGELRKHGVKLKLQDQPVQILILLLEHPGEIVTREQIQKRLWPDNTYVDFDNAINSSIRKLRDALGDSAENPRFVETLARRGYRFIAPVSTAGISPQKTLVALEPAVPETPADRQVKPVSNRPWLRWALVVPVVALSLLLFVLPRPAVPPSQYEAAPVTTEAGMQLCPSFAPDGQRVTFSWDGEKQDNFDIYAKQIGAESSLRLTTDPRPDLSPAWSPDGNTIAFIRIASSTRAQVLQISAFAGGQERVVAEIAAPSHMYREVRLLNWSPDGKWLAVSDETPETHSAIYLLSVESGAKRQLTQPGATDSDFDPAFSSDGSRLAFARQAGPGVGELYVLKLTRELKPVGELQQITFDHRRTSSPVWAPDGRSLLCVRLILPTRNSLCKITLSNPLRVESVSVPAENVVALALAPRNSRLIYVRQTSNLNLWAVDIPTRDAREHTNPTPRLWHASSRHDATPSFSPDGQQVAFQSLRSGWDEIWVADRNGSHLRQLTDLHGTVAGFPRWSPDGRTIVFQLRKQTVARLFLLDVAAARSRPVPYPVVNDAIPSWSRDGQWIYFQSRRSGETQIWKVAATGGQPLQVTRQGGWTALESADGRSLFYSKASSPGLWRMALSDGKEQQLFSAEIAGHKSAYAPGRTGIYFIRQGTADQKDVLQFFPFDGGATRKLADIERPTEIGLALSPDERMIVYCQVDHLSSELMLVENFR